MATIRMSMKDLIRYQKQLGKDFKAVAERGVVSGAMACLPVLVRSTDEMKAFNNGDYRRAWNSEPINKGARVFNKMKYAGVIELGRRKNKKPPPSKAIQHWAQRKMGLSEVEARSAAYAIARSIGTKGIQGRHVMKRVRPEMVRVVMREVQHEMISFLRRGRV